MSGVNAEVVLDIGGDKTLAASITASSAKNMELSAPDTVRCSTPAMCCSRSD
ncbi:MAG: TOBE domain-containing protein [Rhodopseudomonas palustris]|nr:TOBE domain-containing protein [Rhodopseudomonas palustris]